jgi:hypothetical protein
MLALDYVVKSWRRVGVFQIQRGLASPRFKGGRVEKEIRNKKDSRKLP